MLDGELRGLRGDVNVLITHIKPGEVEAVMREIEHHDHDHAILALRAGQLLLIPGQ